MSEHFCHFPDAVTHSMLFGLCGGEKGALRRSHFTYYTYYNYLWHCQSEQISLTLGMKMSGMISIVVSVHETCWSYNVMVAQATSDWVWTDFYPAHIMTNYQNKKNNSDKNHNFSSSQLQTKPKTHSILWVRPLEAWRTSCCVDFCFQGLCDLDFALFLYLQPVCCSWICSVLASCSTFLLLDLCFHAWHRVWRCSTFLLMETF